MLQDFHILYRKNLSQHKTQLMSNCMKSVCRLLGVKQSTTTPHHLMSKSSMARNKNVDQAVQREAKRCFNALHFAYREMPQDSTELALLELIYCWAVRPIHGLRKL